MSTGIVEQTKTIKTLKTVCAGAVASLLTQPFQVLKTNMINSPSLYKDLHHFIIRDGWVQYMRGSPIAIIRQGYGFAIYTNLIQKMTTLFHQHFPQVSKYYKYSLSAVVSKTIAMLFQAPLTLLKTRVQVVSTRTINSELNLLLKNPMNELSRGFGPTLARQGVYSIIHYNFYRFMKDEVFESKQTVSATFTSAFSAGMLAITMSQPFEVIRSKVSLSSSQTFWNCLNTHFHQSGFKGLFRGFLPRLLRKPINSGICWTIMEATISKSQ